MQYRYLLCIVASFATLGGACSIEPTDPNLVPDDLEDTHQVRDAFQRYIRDSGDDVGEDELQAYMAANGANVYCIGVGVARDEDAPIIIDERPDFIYCYSQESEDFQFRL